MHELSLEPRDADRAVLGLRDLQRLGAVAGPRVEAAGVQQVADVVSVELQELYFNIEFAELGLPPSILYLCEDEIKDPRHDTDLVERQADCAARTHGMGLTTTCLAIG